MISVFGNMMKLSMVLLCWILYQLAPMNGDFIGQVFEYSIAFGVLLLVLFTLYREWKSGVKYSRTQEEELRQLTRQCVIAMENVTERMDDLIEEIRRDRKTG